MQSNMNRMIPVAVRHLGVRDYPSTLEIQKNFFTLMRRRHNEQLNQLKSSSIPHQRITPNSVMNTLLIVEHSPAIYTMGRRDTSADLLNDDPSKLEAKTGTKVIKTSRGGAVTWHGPGQVVIYPIIDLSEFGMGVRRYVEAIEEVIIDALAKMNIKSGTTSDVGVWIGEKKKIAAIGIAVSNWITMHGLSLNVKNDLTPFDAIIPCGIRDKSVTNMEKELGQKVDMSQVQQNLIESFSRVFNAEIQEVREPFVWESLMTASDKNVVIEKSNITNNK